MPKRGDWNRLDCANRSGRFPVPGDVVRIELNCAACGSNRFSLDRGQSDQSLIICEECGHEIGTLGALKAKLAEEVMRRSGSTSS